MMRYAIYLSHIFSRPCPVKTWITNTLNKRTRISLGRWNLEDCPKKTEKKAHWANEDHCGPCGNTDVKKSTHQK